MTIDWWTLGIQTVNVVILIWLLQRFFWRPVAAMIEQRRADGASSFWPRRRRSASAGDRRAGRDRTDARRLREGARSDPGRGPRGRESRRAPRCWRRRRRQAAALEAAAKAAIEKERRDAEAPGPSGRARLLSKSPDAWPPAWTARRCEPAFLDWLIREIGALPEAVRQAVAADGVALEAVSATPLDPAEQERLPGTDRRGVRWPSDRSTFRMDPALIAGLELRGPTWS